MESIFTNKFFTANRLKLRQSYKDTVPIVVCANGLLQRGGDSTYAFSQDANFWYLTGIDEPDIVLVMDDEEYLIVPERSANRAAFDGAPTSKALTLRSGIQTIYDEIAGWEQLQNKLKKISHIATLSAPPAYVEHYGLYTNPARAALIARLEAFKSDLELNDINPYLTRLRMIKQPAELVAIQSAIDITIKTIEEATLPGKLQSYTHEYQLEAEFKRGFRSLGTAGHAFEPIVASGIQACTLHNVANSSPLSPDDLVLIDVGAEVEHYAADLTRTISLSAPSPRQQAVHSAVLDVQRFAFDLLKPGVLLKEYEQQVENYMGEKLCDLGVIKTITHDNVRAYFPHATSHFLGLNVHDVGDYDKPLEPGIVLTVEPGIYIPSEGIGIRIEDDTLITTKGHKILSQKLPRELT